jgi:predicted metal-dependent HD superfamily phosphohydrolase
MLKEIYTKLLVSSINSDEIEWMWHNLEKAYSAKSRHYHNLNHLEEMVLLFETYQKELQFPNEVLFSIFYHDSIYKVTRKDNELKSAEYALSLLTEKTTFNKQLVYDMIVATQQHQHNKIEDINWLIDFDLKILSKDWDDYKIYCQQIRQEYKIYPNLLYNPGRKKALQHFLESEFIYQTQEFRTLHEEKARENIEKEIKEL